MAEQPQNAPVTLTTLRVTLHPCIPTSHSWLLHPGETPLRIPQTPPTLPSPPSSGQPLAIPSLAVTSLHANCLQTLIEVRQVWMRLPAWRLFTSSSVQHHIVTDCMQASDNGGARRTALHTRLTHAHGDAVHAQPSQQTAHRLSASSHFLCRSKLH